MFAAIRNGLKNSAAEDGTIYLIIEGVTSIPENFLGFYEDDNKNEVPAVDKLYGISLPDVTTIGEYAFSWSGLQSGTFGSLTKISAAMFMNCEELTDLTFGKVITSIESSNWCELASTSQTTLTLAYGQDQITFENSDLNLNPDRNRFGDYTFKEIIIFSAEEM